MRIASRRLTGAAAALCAVFSLLLAVGAGPVSIAQGKQPPKLAPPELAIEGALWHQPCAKCRRRLGTEHTKSLTIPWRHKAALTIRLRHDHRAIPNATLTVTRHIKGKPQRAVAQVKTDRHGRARLRLYGPNAVWKVTYGQLSEYLRVRSHAYISFHATELRGGHRARFHGFVQGGTAPAEGLVVQLSENSGSGWQSFGPLARLNAHTHQWKLSLKIPKATRGYSYRLRATVLNQPDWPWLTTSSRTLRRKVV